MSKFTDALDEARRKGKLPEVRLLAELEREIAMRYDCYPRWVDSGKLSAKTAAERIVLLEQSLIELRELIRSRESVQTSLF